MVIWIGVGGRLGQQCQGMLPQRAAGLSLSMLTSTNLHPSLNPGNFPGVISYIYINFYRFYMQKSLKTCLLDKFSLSPNGLNSYFTPNSISVRARSSPTLVTYLSCINRLISVQSGCLILLNAEMVQNEIPKTFIWSCHFTLYKSSRPTHCDQSKIENCLGKQSHLYIPGSADFISRHITRSSFCVFFSLLSLRIHLPFWSSRWTFHHLKFRHLLFISPIHPFSSNKTMTCPWLSVFLGFHNIYH